MGDWYVAQVSDGETPTADTRLTAEDVDHLKRAAKAAIVTGSVFLPRVRFPQDRASVTVNYRDEWDTERTEVRIHAKIVTESGDGTLAYPGLSGDSIRLLGRLVRVGDRVSIRGELATDRASPYGVSVVEHDAWPLVHIVRTEVTLHRDRKSTRDDLNSSVLVACWMDTGPSWVFHPQVAGAAPQTPLVPRMPVTEVVYMAHRLVLSHLRIHAMVYAEAVLGGKGWGEAQRLSLEAIASMNRRQYALAASRLASLCRGWLLENEDEACDWDRVQAMLTGTQVPFMGAADVGALAGVA